MYNRFKWTPASVGRNRFLRNYEPLQPYVLASLIERYRCDVFIDVGAMIGTYAVLLSPLVEQVHAFEPGGASFEHLRRNVALNDLGSKITIHQRAVSDEAKKVRFGIYKPLGGANSIIETSIHASGTFAREATVETVRLDDYLPLKDQRVCLKIDIEGHEPSAIAGMTKLLSENEIILQIEEYGDRKLTEQLGALGLKPLFRVGPDRYFSNLNVSDRVIVEAFEKGSAQMIATLLGPQEQGSPLNISLGPLLSVELKGRGAAVARKVRSLLHV